MPEAVVGALRVKIFGTRDDGPGLRIRRPVNHSGQAGMDAGRGAHGTGLKGDHQHAAPKPVIAQAASGLAQGQDFGMGRGIVQAHRGVARFRQHCAVRSRDNRAHRYFSGSGGQSGALKRTPHEALPAMPRRRGGHRPGWRKNANSPISGGRAAGMGEEKV